MASSSSDHGQAPVQEPQKTSDSTGSSASAGSKSRAFAASWASKLGQKAFDLKAVTKEAMQQTKEAMQSTKEAFTAEAKMVAKDMADLKDGVAEGMRLTVQDTQHLRERIGQQTRQIFAKDSTGADAEIGSRSEATASIGGEEDPKSEPKKGLFGPDTTEQLKGKVQDLKAGGKKAAEKVRDVGGKLWHKTDHWFHQLRGDLTKDGTVPAASWDECHQHALELFGPEPGSTDDLVWTLEELKMGALDVYAKSTVMFYHPSDKTMLDEILSGSETSPFPRMATYCKTPMRVNEERCDVHIFSFSKSFLEVDISPMDDLKRTVLREKLQWLCYTVSACASQHHLSIAWHLPGGAMEIPLLENSEAEVSLEGLQELCKMMMKDQLKSFPEVDLSTTRLPEISTLAGSEDTASTLFVTTAEPWRGMMREQGVFGTCTAMALLCRPSTNPYGPKQVPLMTPQDLPSNSKPATAAAAAAAAAATAAVGVDLLDMGEEVPPEVVIGDDDFLDEEPSPSRTEQPMASEPVMSGGAAVSVAPVANGSASGSGGYVATPSQANLTDQDEPDWLDELTAEPLGPAAVPSPAPAAGQMSGDDKAGIEDADFDALWDSMIDEVDVPHSEAANGAHSVA